MRMLCDPGECPTPHPVSAALSAVDMSYGIGESSPVFFSACRCKTCVPRSMMMNLQLSAGKEVLGLGLTLPTMDILTSTPFDFSRGTSTELNQPGSCPKLPSKPLQTYFIEVMETYHE